MTSSFSAEDIASATQPERADAIREVLRSAGSGAVLLFDPDNVAFATGYAVRADANISHADRWALVTVSGAAVVWEHPAVLSALRPKAEEGVELRPAVGLDLLGRHDDGHDQFGAEIGAALSRAGVDGQPLAVDVLEASGFLSLRRRGLEIRDGAEVMDAARAALRYG